MPDEPIEGQPEVATAPEKPVEAPAPVEVQTAPPPTSKYGGKSVEELARMLEEKDSYISTVSAEKSKYEHDANYFKTLAEQIVRGKEEPKQPDVFVPSVDEPSEEELITNPKQAVKKLVAAQLARERQERERQDAVRYQESMRNSFNEGWTKAVASNPKIYSGLEQAVLTSMATAVKEGSVKDPGVLRDPQAWEAMAGLIRFTAGERDLSKYYHSAPTPVSPVQTEVPKPTGAPRESAVLSEHEKSLARTFGLTEEQYIAARKKEMEENR